MSPLTKREMLYAFLKRSMVKDQWIKFVIWTSMHRLEFIYWCNEFCLSLSLVIFVSYKPYYIFNYILDIYCIISLNLIFLWCKGLFRYGYVKFICRYIISEFLIFQHVIGCLGLFEFEFDSTWKDYLNMNKIFEYYFWICNILYIRILFKYEWKIIFLFFF